MTRESATADGWIELPGLFEASELAGVADLQIRSRPLVIVGNRVLYGVYVREMASDGSEREVSAVRTIDVDALMEQRRRARGA